MEFWHIFRAMTDMGLILFMLAWFCGGVVNGMMGMGGAMVALPVVSLTMDMSLAIPASCLTAGALSAEVAWRYRKDASLGLVLPMAMGSLPGTVAGALILKILPQGGLRIGLGIILTLYALWSVLGKPVQCRSPARPWLLLAGFLSGTSNSAVSFGAPPVAVYASFAGWSKDMARGTMGLYFVFMTFFTLGAQSMAGLHNTLTLAVACLGLPAGLLGGIIAAPLSRSLRDGSYRRLLYWFIAGAGAFLVYRGLGQF